MTWFRAGDMGRTADRQPHFMQVNEEDAMNDEKKAPEKTNEGEDMKDPVSEICGNAEELAASLVDDDSEIKPVDGFFLTSQRWH